MNGANIKHISRNGYTSLHQTAMYANSDVLKVHAARKQLLRGVDTGHKDRAGRTAHDILQDRFGESDGVEHKLAHLWSSRRPHGFEDEFERLLSSLEEEQSQHIGEAQPNPT